MKSTILAIIGVLTAFYFHAANAGESHYFGDRDPTAETCYRATVAASRGELFPQPAISACNKALRRGPHTSEHKSTVYHNRAILERALGHPDKARKSLERAVALSAEVGLQHLALAQLAFQQGDIERSLDLYNQLLDDGLHNPLIAGQAESLARNRDQLQQSVNLWPGLVLELSKS